MPTDDRRTDAGQVLKGGNAAFTAFVWRHDGFNGAVTVSAVPDEQSSEVGGLQNTVTNLGASLATALTGSILIAVLPASFLTHI